MHNRQITAPHPKKQILFSLHGNLGYSPQAKDNPICSHTFKKPVQLVCITQSTKKFFFKKINKTQNNYHHPTNGHQKTLIAHKRCIDERDQKRTQPCLSNILKAVPGKLQIIIKNRNIREIVKEKKRDIL
jgi:hypothetical protein